MLIRAGGVLDGVIAVVTVVVIGSHGCCERIVVLKVWRLVSGTTSKVHVVDAELGGSPSRSIVRVPLHVPARNDWDDDGPVGLEEPPPQPAKDANVASTQQVINARAVILQPLP